MRSFSIGYKVKGARVATAVCEALVEGSAAFTVEPMPDDEWEVSVKDEAAHMRIVEGAIASAWPLPKAPVYCGCGELLEKDQGGEWHHLYSEALSGADDHEPSP